MVLFKQIRSVILSWKYHNAAAPLNIMPVRGLKTKSLIYSEFGEPKNVVKMIESELPALQDGQALIRMIASPVNPADINTIQGKYPVKVIMPCIPGNEGVGEVLEVKATSHIKPGNKVIVTKPLQGCWRKEAIIDTKLLRVVPDNLGNIEAATLTVNPCTAYRMLSDFKPVKEQCLSVIQNGANSACGQAVIQICKAWNICTVNIVRDRPNINELKDFLTNLGAGYVLTEEELRTTKLFKDRIINRPALGLNCVGGKSSQELLRHLQHSGAMVTYGGMSREPVTVPTSALIFKNIACHGFWVSAWNETAPQEAREKMWDELIDLMLEKKLKGPVHKLIKFDNYIEAMENALSVKGFTGQKYILDFTEC